MHQYSNNYFYCLCFGWNTSFTLEYKAIFVLLAIVEKGNLDGNLKNLEHCNIYGERISESHL